MGRSLRRNRRARTLPGFARLDSRGRLSLRRTHRFLRAFRRHMVRRRRRDRPRLYRSLPASKYVYDDGDVSVQKSYTFDRDSYVVGVRTAVEVTGAQVTAFPIWPAGFGGDTTGAQYATGQIVYQYDNKVERLAIKKISGGGTMPGPFHWAGGSEQNFASGVFT